MINRVAHLRFVAVVRRRMGAWQFLDALLVASCSGAIVAAIGDRFSNRAVPVAASVAVVVLVWRTVRGWPTSAAAAALIDTQFHWNELIQSACVAPASPGDDLRSAVAAIADARCASADRSALSLRPFGAGRTATAAILLLMAVAVWVAPRGRGADRREATSLADAPPLVDRPVRAGSVEPGTMPRATASNEPDESSSRRGPVERITKPAVNAAASAPRGHAVAGAGRGWAGAVAVTPTVATPGDASPSAPTAGTVSAGDGEGPMAAVGLSGAGHGVVTEGPPSGVTAWAGNGVGRQPIGRAPTSPRTVPDRDADLVRAFFDR